MSPTDLDELRRLMHGDWGDLAAGGRPALENTDRAATLYGRAHDPYHALALADLDAERFLLIGIYNTLEQGDWRLYYKFVNRLCALQIARERAQSRLARAQPLAGNAPPTQAAQTNAPPVAPRAPCPPRAVMDAMPAREVVALCAERVDMTEAQFRQAHAGKLPFK